MKISYKQIGLVVGLTFIFWGFIYFGREQETYMFLVTVGLLVSFICFLLILFGKHTIRTRVIWALVIISYIFLEREVEPYLIDYSFRTYVQANEPALIRVKDILFENGEDITILKDIDSISGSGLNYQELKKLSGEMENLKLYMVQKIDRTIYFGLWGFLDVRIGLFYRPANVGSDIRYRQVVGNWYR